MGQSFVLHENIRSKILQLGKQSRIWYYVELRWLPVDNADVMHISVARLSIR